MSLFKSPVFIICCVLFIAHQVVQLVFENRISFVHSYLDSLLAMPIILTLILAERIYLFRWNNYYRLNLLEVFLGTLFVAIVSEIIFPALSDDFTGDWMDLLFFVFGAFIFYFSINPKKKKY